MSDARVNLCAEANGKAPGRGRLQGRRILVVGAGQRPLDPALEPDENLVGNGRAISLLAAREGAQVACADKDEVALDGTIAALKNEGVTACRIVADATDETSVDNMVKEAAASLGGLDGLVLNVGGGTGKGLAGTPLKLWERLFAVNVRSAFLGCKSALPLMSDDGAIVFMSSIAAYKPITGFPGYDSSKSALEGLCRHVAKEGAPKRVRANIVVPGLIDTPVGRLGTIGRPERAETPVPLGRQGTGWEIAYATIFLLSNEASYITGQALRVDGGFTSLV